MVIFQTLIIRDRNDAIIDEIDLKPGDVVTAADVRALIRRHNARSVERITTTERRPS